VLKRREPTGLKSSILLCGGKCQIQCIRCIGLTGEYLGKAAEFFRSGRTARITALYSLTDRPNDLTSVAPCAKDCE
jgi:hypothetical protein